MDKWIEALVLALEGTVQLVLSAMIDLARVFISPSHLFATDIKSDSHDIRPFVFVVFGLVCIPLSMLALGRLGIEFETQTGELLAYAFQLAGQAELSSAMLLIPSILLSILLARVMTNTAGWAGGEPARARVAVYYAIGAAGILLSVGGFLLLLYAIIAIFGAGCGIHIGSSYHPWWCAWRDWSVFLAVPLAIYLLVLRVYLSAFAAKGWRRWVVAIAFATASFLVPWPFFSLVNAQTLRATSPPQLVVHLDDMLSLSEGHTAVLFFMNQTKSSQFIDKRHLQVTFTNSSNGYGCYGICSGYTLEMSDPSPLLEIPSGAMKLLVVRLASPPKVDAHNVCYRFEGFYFDALGRHDFDQSVIEDQNPIFKQPALSVSDQYCRVIH
jgi:hypothetical protein